MKPATLVAAMLVAGTAAGIAPQFPRFMKSNLAPSITSQQKADNQIKIGWPTSTPPIFFQGSRGKYTVYLPLQNSNSETQCVSIEAKVRQANGKEQPAAVEPKDFPIAESTSISKLITLTLPDSTGGPGSGYLRIYTKPQPKPDTSSTADALTKVPSTTNSCKSAIDGGQPFNQELRIPEEPWMGKVFWTSLIMALLVVAITMINLVRKGISLFHLMGAPNWSFEKSWGANVTLGGALLMTLLGLTIFPDHPQLMAKISYTVLQILFGALVSLAPLVYNLIHRDVQVNNNGITQVNSQGYVLLFLIAGGIVLWAAMGQVVTFGVLVEEFVRGSTLDAATGYALKSLAVLLFALLLVYGLRSLYRTPKNVSASPAVAGGVMPGPRPAAAAGLPAPMAEWSIL